MSVLNTILTATLEKSRGKLILAAMKSHALMAWAFANDRVEYEDGGYNITNPLIVGRNPNVTSYEYYDQLPMAPTDEFAKVEYRWSRVAGSLIISEQEQDENRGETAVFKLLEKKMEILEESIKEKFGSYLYGAGAGTDPLGLSALVPDDPTSGSIGNLSRATEPQWRSSSYDFAGTLDSTVIEEAFDDILMDLTMKGDKPSIILAGRNIYRIYRAAVRDKVMISLTELGGGNGKKMVDLGFNGIAHQGVPIIYDEDCPVNKAYFLNDKYLRLHMLKGVNMRVKQLSSPWNMDAVGRRTVWQGQWCSWRNYRTHAVLAA